MRTKQKGQKLLIIGVFALAVFLLWTLLIQTVDVRPVGQEGTEIGFAALNTRFHELTGVHMSIYHATDLLELLAIAVCVFFGGVGLVQLIKRKSLFKVDADILLLGGYYIVVICCYLFFEKFPVNYRPVLIEGVLEASYPSSTTLLVLSVMPTLVFQTNRRVKDAAWRILVDVPAILFALFILVARTVAGVHWLTDIIGAILLSAALYLLYRACVCFFADGKNVSEK